MNQIEKSLLIIMERGGYPNFSNIIKNAGYTLNIVNSMRKAISDINHSTPKIVIAEFNFQTDFRDRSSSLESCMATLQRYPDVKVIVFYEKEHQIQFNRLRERYDFHGVFDFPISESALEKCILEV